MKNYLKKFEYRPSTFHDKRAWISEWDFEKLLSTNKYFSKKCPWYSREENFLKGILLARLYFNHKCPRISEGNFMLDPELFKKSVLGYIEGLKKFYLRTCTF